MPRESPLAHSPYPRPPFCPAADEIDDAEKWLFCRRVFCILFAVCSAGFGGERRSVDSCKVYALCHLRVMLRSIFAAAHGVFASQKIHCNLWASAFRKNCPVYKGNASLCNL